MRLRPSRQRQNGQRIFFATDVHGSETCFRKFLNAGEFYECDALVLGGDIVGKVLIPITRRPNGTFSARYGEQIHEDLDEVGLRALKESIRRAGSYYHVGGTDEIEQLAEPETLDGVFRRAVYDSVTDWVALADERLRGTGRQCFVAPGNDDFLEIDDALQGSDSIVFAEGRVVGLTERHEMITTGYSNVTPWDTERELPEPALRQRIESMAVEVAHRENLVAVLHAPPFDSGLDGAPKLDGTLKMSMTLGGVATAPVGSTAVRDFIEEWQPLLGLHGHVHEGRGVVRIGRTVCVNPGSEYTEGVLSGAIVELGDEQVLTTQLVAG
jgi:Icc-related predicted phosphoesterase